MDPNGVFISNSIPPECYASSVLVVSAPEKNKHHEFIKHSHTSMLFEPLGSRELLCAWLTVPEWHHSVSLELLRWRIDMFGGTIRFVLGKNNADVRAALVHAGPDEGSCVCRE